MSDDDKRDAVLEAREFAAQAIEFVIEDGFSDSFCQEIANEPYFEQFVEEVYALRDRLRQGTE